MTKSKVRRSRASPKYVYYALTRLSLRKTSERLSALIRRNHVSIWNWIQRYKPKRIFQSRRRISEFIIDETFKEAGSDYVRLWIAIEPKDKMILDIRISPERSILVAEQFTQSLIRKYGKHDIQLMVGHGIHKHVDSLTWNITYIHSSIEKSFIERTIQYIKDRTEYFDDYFPCTRSIHSQDDKKEWQKSIRK